MTNVKNQNSASVTMQAMEENKKFLVGLTKTSKKGVEKVIDFESVGKIKAIGTRQTSMNTILFYANIFIINDLTKQVTKAKEKVILATSSNVKEAEEEEKKLNDNLELLKSYHVHIKNALKKDMPTRENHIIGALLANYLVSKSNIKFIDLKELDLITTLEASILHNLASKVGQSAQNENEKDIKKYVQEYCDYLTGEKQKNGRFQRKYNITDKNIKMILKLIVKVKKDGIGLTDTRPEIVSAKQIQSALQWVIAMLIGGKIYDEKIHINEKILKEAQRTMEEVCQEQAKKGVKPEEVKTVKSATKKASPVEKAVDNIVNIINE